MAEQIDIQVRRFVMLFYLGISLVFRIDPLMKYNGTIWSEDFELHLKRGEINNRQKAL